ncbi:hypothetical protein BSM4216_0514 [Bacillus smithii]|nr:hypothetical protein BSM4216_0514 [Bacillus smithii]
MDQIQTEIHEIETIYGKECPGCMFMMSSGNGRDVEQFQSEIKLV